MNADEIMVLLQVAQSYDSRNIDRLMQSAWLDASQRACWDRDAALAAVRAHYAESTERIMPGHVTARIRAARPAPGYAPKYVRELLPAPPATAEQREAARRLFVPTGRTQRAGNEGLRARRRGLEGPEASQGGRVPQRAFTGDLGAIFKRARKDDR